MNLDTTNTFEHTSSGLFTERSLHEAENIMTFRGLDLM
jgi:hypothetical protein